MGGRPIALCRRGAARIPAANRARGFGAWDEAAVRSRRARLSSGAHEPGRAAGRPGLGRGARGIGPAANLARSARALGSRRIIADAASELPIAGLIDGSLSEAVIDRTFIDEGGVRWIIDYKTSTHEGGDLENFLEQEKDRYREQLERYARLMVQAR